LFFSMDIITFDGNGYRVEILQKVPKHRIADKIIIVQGGDDGVNREVVSSQHVDILLDPHLGKRHDAMHQRDSGLNHVLCALAKEHHVAIGFSFVAVLHAQNRAKLLGRMMQNIKLCRKYKVRIVIGSFAKEQSDARNVKDMQSFFRVLGMTGKEVQMNFIDERLDYKRRFIKKGVTRAK